MAIVGKPGYPKMRNGTGSSDLTASAAFKASTTPGGMGSPFLRGAGDAGRAIRRIRRKVVPSGTHDIAAPTTSATHEGVTVPPSKRESYAAHGDSRSRPSTPTSSRRAQRIPRGG